METKIDEDGVRHVVHEIESTRTHETKGRGARKTMTRGVVRWKGYTDEFDEVVSVEWLCREVPAMLLDYIRLHGLRVDAGVERRAQELTRGAVASDVRS